MQGAEGEQREDVGHQQKALVDMWVLSLSDILLTSHMSTFGYTAQGLGGLTPYHLKPWLDNACWLSVSSDPCFHFAPGRVECPGDNFTMESPLKEAPYVTKCPDLPDTGIQLAEWALGRHVDVGPLVPNGLFQRFQSVEERFILLCTTRASAPRKIDWISFQLQQYQSTHASILHLGEWSAQVIINFTMQGPLKKAPYVMKWPISQTQWHNQLM